MDFIPVFRNVYTLVQLNEDREFQVNIDMDLSQGNEYYLKIIFQDLTLFDTEYLLKLAKEPRTIKLSSPYFDNEGYKIDEIVIAQFTLPGDGTFIWNCITDRPHNLEYKR